MYPYDSSFRPVQASSQTDLFASPSSHVPPAMTEIAISTPPLDDRWTDGRAACARDRTILRPGIAIAGGNRESTWHVR